MDLSQYLLTPRYAYPYPLGVYLNHRSYLGLSAFGPYTRFWTCGQGSKCIVFKYVSTCKEWQTLDSDDVHSFSRTTNQYCGWCDLMLVKIVTEALHLNTTLFSTGTEPATNLIIMFRSNGCYHNRSRTNAIGDSFENGVALSHPCHFAMTEIH